MKIRALVILELAWFGLFYLLGVFITGEWDSSHWDAAAKAFALIAAWLPGAALIAFSWAEACKKAAQEGRG